VSVVVAIGALAGVFTILNLLIDRLPERVGERIRPWVFVLPAVLFLSAFLAVPAIRTVILSFRGGSDGEEGFTVSNWTEQLSNDSVLGLDGWTGIFTSRLFIFGVIVIVIALLLARRSARRSGDPGLDLSGPGTTILGALAILAVLFAVFTTLRGVVWNNLWWVVVVAGFSTAFGLALAVLADRSRSESLAKTLIFMPMAISLVGAAVIWKFVYDVGSARQAPGLLNVLWPGGSIDFIRGSTESGGTISPWNNFFIMVIMIWIQAGFAMVVLSAAIKGVPTELGEAARVDGANEAQVFWRITLPQITSTVAVVVTTLTVTVLKIFDLVKATSNGQAGTDVLANRMYEGLRTGNNTLAAVFASMILVLVLPIMYFNVRRTSREAAA
jgi:ABC-type sugar transport system permease subunit